MDVHTMLVVGCGGPRGRQARRSSEGDERAVLLFSGAVSRFRQGDDHGASRERDGKMRWTSWGHEGRRRPHGASLSGTHRYWRARHRLNKWSCLSRESFGVIEHRPGRDATRGAPPGHAPGAREHYCNYCGGSRPITLAVRSLARGICRREQFAFERWPKRRRCSEKPQAPPLILGRHVLPHFENRPGKAHWRSDRRGVRSASRRGFLNRRRSSPMAGKLFCQQTPDR